MVLAPGEARDGLGRVGLQERLEDEEAGEGEVLPKAALTSRLFSFFVFCRGGLRDKTCRAKKSTTGSHDTAARNWYWEGKLIVQEEKNTTRCLCVL